MYGKEVHGWVSRKKFIKKLHAMVCTSWVFCLSHSNRFIMLTHNRCADPVAVPFKFTLLLLLQWSNFSSVRLQGSFRSVIEGGSVSPPPWPMCWISLFWNHEDNANTCKQYLIPMISSPITSARNGMKQLNNNAHSLQENRTGRLNFVRLSAEIDPNELPREMPASIKRGDAHGELLDSRFLSVALYYQMAPFSITLTKNNWFRDRVPTKLPLIDYFGRLFCLTLFFLMKKKAIFSLIFSYGYFPNMNHAHKKSLLI